MNFKMSMVESKWKKKYNYQDCEPKIFYLH